MRTINHLLASIFVFALTVPMFAITPGHVVVTTNNGSQSTMSLGDIRSVTFADGKMNIASVSGDMSFINLADIEKITFDMATSAVEDITKSLGDDIIVSVKNGLMTITSSADTPINVAVFNLNGTMVDSQSAVSEIAIDFNPMNPGVYVVRANNKTIKFIR